MGNANCGNIQDGPQVKCQAKPAGMVTAGGVD